MNILVNTEMQQLMVIHEMLPTDPALSSASNDNEEQMQILNETDFK